MPKVVGARDFVRCLRELRKRAKKGKDAEMKARAAQQQAGADGEISIVPRTRHGEGRLPDVEKYDLGDGYRLVVQLIDPKNKIRAFLFAGDHAETEHWLETHPNYRWVMRESDQRLEFVPVTEASASRVKLFAPDYQPPAHVGDLPLLRDLTAAQWSALALPEPVAAYTETVSCYDWECDSNGVIEHIERIAGEDIALLMIDIFTLAHEEQAGALAQRIELRSGQASIPCGEEAVAAMTAPVNSDAFITWDELSQFPADGTWADWMLFLHPEQKRLASQEFAGPARLRGVSGSGKTCVMVHRARHLAKKYSQKVLLVTLTESMWKLLDNLANELCGPKHAGIYTSTLNRLAEEVIGVLHPQGLLFFTPATKSFLSKLKADVVELVRQDADFARSGLKDLNIKTLQSFIWDECTYVRTRLSRSKYAQYLSAKEFPRYGRGRPLTEAGRRVFMKAVRHWDSQLDKARPSTEKESFRWPWSWPHKTRRDLKSVNGMTRTSRTFGHALSVRLRIGNGIGAF